MEFEDIIAGKERPDKSLGITTLAWIEEALDFMIARYTKAQADGNWLEINSTLDKIKMLIDERESLRAKQAESPTPPARILLTDAVRVSLPPILLKEVAPPPSSLAVDQSTEPVALHTAESAASSSMSSVAPSTASPQVENRVQSTISTGAEQPALAQNEIATDVLPVELPKPAPAQSKGGQEPELVVAPSTRKKPGRPRRSDAPLREGKGQTVSVVMPPMMVARIDELATSGLWRSRSDVIVYAMREYLKHGFDAAHPVPLPAPPKRRVGRPSMTKAQKQAAAAARKAAKATADNTQGGQDGAATQ